MSEDITLPVVGPDGRTRPWVFDCSWPDDEAYEEYTVTATDPEGTVWTGSGADMFDALRSLRRDLDAVGHRPLCVGARRNARVSAMSSQMSGGTAVYLLKPRRVPSRTAWIFDPADAADVGSVAEQDAFWEHWLRQPARWPARTAGSVRSTLKDGYFRLRYR